MPTFQAFFTCRPPVSQMWGPLQRQGMPAYLDLTAMPVQLLWHQKKHLVKPTGIYAVSKLQWATPYAAVTCSAKVDLFLAGGDFYVKRILSILSGSPPS